MEINNQINGAMYVQELCQYSVDYILYPNPHSWINGGGKLPVPATVQLNVC